jgi:hypothetical protein
LTVLQIDLCSYGTSNLCTSSFLDQQGSLPSWGHFIEKKPKTFNSSSFKNYPVRRARDGTTSTRLARDGGVLLDVECSGEDNTLPLIILRQQHRRSPTERARFLASAHYLLLVPRTDRHCC